MKRSTFTQTAAVGSFFEPLEPRLMMDGAGSVCTEGFGIHNVGTLWNNSWPGWLSNPPTGQAPGEGVKVGVISNGVASSNAAVDSGDLPDEITIDTQRPGLLTKHEGTEMLEVIHDIAPGADLYFSGPEDSSQMVDSIDWMVNQGVNVIVDDLWWPDQPFFEDGSVAQAASVAISAGVTYVSAAGNWAEKHYQGVFSPDANGYQVFNQNWTIPNALWIDVPTNQTISVALQWSDQWGAADSDYELDLVDANGNPLQPTVENGGDNPYKIGSWSNTGNEISVGWQVKWAGQGDPPSRQIEMYLFGGPKLKFTATTSFDRDSISGQAAADGVIAVAASDAAGWLASPPNPQIEWFSSQDSSTIFTNISTQTSIQRDALDVTAVDNVSTLSGGSHGFGGTSAASAHVAGIAALLKCLWPDATPAEIGSALRNGADAVGTAYTAGSGLADAMGAQTAMVAARTLSTPTSVDLESGYDAGWYNDDDFTNLDNSSGKELKFDVAGTTSGATVKLWADHTHLIGTAVSSGGTVTIETNGTYALDAGEHAITATQAKTNMLDSNESSTLTVTIDAVSPQVAENYPVLNNGGHTETGFYSMDIQFTEGVDETPLGGALSFYHYDDTNQEWGLVENLSPNFSYDWGTNTGHWSAIGVTLPTMAPGWYCAVLSRSGVTDQAGNQMAGRNYVVLLLLQGDANGDRMVDISDLTILATNFDRTDATLGPQEGDFNWDGCVDVSDLSILSTNFDADFSVMYETLPTGASS